jgi:hypothetical protein
LSWYKQLTEKIRNVQKLWQDPDGSRFFHANWPMPLLLNLTKKLITANIGELTRLIKFSTKILPLEKMIFFNFLYAPDGGGYQNSLSFVHSLKEMGFSFKKIVFLIYRDTEIHDICLSSKINHIAIKNNVLNKIFFEIRSRKYIRKNDIIFSIFGPPMLTNASYTLNIGGMAISNVFYKDIDFWEDLNPILKFYKMFKDKYRLHRYSKSDYWIFETNILKKRAVSELGYPINRCHVVKMSHSKLIGKNFINHNSVYNYLKNINNCFLFLCGAHPNKRLHILPELALKLMKRGFYDFKFIITAKPNNYLKQILKESKKKKVLNKFLNIGPVNPNDVPTVIHQCDFMCTFSRLESFSNNFVEAWAMEKPLIVTKDDWSIDSCKNAAYYLELDDLEISSKKIIQLINSSDLRKKIVENGKIVLSEYPSPEMKSLQYLNAIIDAIKIGKRI